METLVEDKKFTLEIESVCLDQRLLEIRQILTASEFKEETNLDLDDVNGLWYNYLTKCLPPIPWTALWEPSGGSRPTPDNSTLSGESRSHFVDVVKIYWEDFTADVEILSIDVLKKNVPLAELQGPIRVSEDDDEYDIPSAKRGLGNLHFFLSYLWFPWDDVSEENDNSKIGWVDKHLENRLEIVRSFFENQSDRDVFIRIGRLAREFSEAYSTISMLRDQYGTDDDCGEETATVIRLEKRLDEIEAEANVLENPTLRTAFESVRISEKQRQHGPTPLNCLVWPFGDFLELSIFLEKVKNLPSFDVSRSTLFASSLQDAIIKCFPDDKIFLPPGVHTFVDFGDLKNGAKISGVNPAETVIEIETKNLIDDFAMFVGGAGAEFEGVSIRATSGDQSALLLRDGTSVLNRIHISGFKVGVKILPGAALVIENSEICDCSRGLEIESGSCVQASDVDIVHNKVGIFVKNITGENIRLNRVSFNSEKDIVVLDEDSNGDESKPLASSLINESTFSDPLVVSCMSE